MSDTPISPNVSLRAGQLTVKTPQSPNEADAAVLAALDTLRRQGRKAGTSVGDENGWAGGIKFIQEEIENLHRYRQSGQSGDYVPKAPTADIPSSQVALPSETPTPAPESLPMGEAALRAALRGAYLQESEIGHGVGYRRSFGAAIHAAAEMLNVLDQSWQANGPKDTTP